jgi:hypothetical protein
MPNIHLLANFGIWRDKIWLAGIFVFLILTSPAWADRILLKSGGEIEGEIIEEAEEYVVLSILGGKGKTRLKKEDIASIEKTPSPKKIQPGSPVKREITSSSREMKSLKEIFSSVKQKKIYKIIPPVVAALLLVYIILIFIMRGRPLGVKLICLLAGPFILISFLFGLMMLSFILNKVFITLEGVDLFVFLLVSLGIPTCLLLAGLGLFYLRNWARIILIVFLISGILNGTVSLIFQRDLIGDYIRGKVATATAPLQDKGLPLSPPKPGEPSSRMAGFINILIFLLGLLYFIKPRTKKFFSPEKRPDIPKCRLIIILAILLFLGDKAYQQLFIRLTHNPYLFARPQKIRVADKDIEVPRGYRDTGALGVRFYLPSGMVRLRKGIPGLVSFADGEKGRIFIMNKIPHQEYRLLSAVERARWNPVLLILKATSPSGGRLISYKEVHLPQGRGIIKGHLRGKRNIKSFQFILGLKRGKVQGIIAGKKNDEFVNEKTVLNMLSLLR